MAPRTPHDITSVARLLQLHYDGEKMAEIDEDFRKLIADTSEHRINTGAKAAKGTMTLTIDVTVEEKDVKVGINHATKVPKKQPAETHYFLSENSELTTQNPRQRELLSGAEMGRGGVTRAD